MQVDTSYASTPGYANRWRALFFLGVALFVIALDNTILNVALPSIARNLSASASELQWIVDAYVLVFAALLLTTGSLGDRIGRKRALMIGLVLFGIGSLIAGLSTTTGMLIATRAFLGFGGAMLMPATLSIITATFPKHERPQAIALWASVWGFGVGIGPVLGGWLVERFAWSSVFFVNLPVVVIAVIGASIFITDSKDEHARRPDIPGVVLSIIGLFALIYGIIEAGVLGWTEPNVLIAFAVAAVVLTAFGIWEYRAPNAMLPLQLFRNMSFTVANIALVLTAFSLFGAVFFLTQYLQTVHGYSAFEAGLLILPQAVALTITSSLSARVARRFGTRRTIAAGVFISAIAMFYMAEVFQPHTPYSLIVIGQVLMTTGLGTAISPATNSVMSSVPVRMAGVGSAMNDTTRQLGGALGVAVLGTILNTRYIQGIEPLRGQLPSEAFRLVSSSVQGAHIAASQPGTPESVTGAITSLANQSFVDGMSSALLIGAVVMALAGLFTLIALPQKRESAETTEPANHLPTGEGTIQPLEAGSD